MWNLFKKRNGPSSPGPRIEGPEIYDYRLVDSSNLADYTHAIEDMYARKLDGLLVKNALSEATCDAIIAKMNKTPEKDRSSISVGWCFPTVFAPLVQEAFRKGDLGGAEKMREYFQNCKAIVEDSESYFGAPVTELIETWLGKFSGGKKFDVPVGYDGKGSYAHTTFRSYYPKGVAYVSIHCGNYFQTVWQEFYQHLEEQVDVYDQLSYFFLLEAPESGGELSLFDFEWELGQGKKNNHENEEVMLPGGKTLQVKERQKMMIRPQKGDLVLFAGGRIWHSVEHVYGKRPRITLAGFLGHRQGKQSYMYWT